jgi:hypothetical protein
LNSEFSRLPFQKQKKVVKKKRTSVCFTLILLAHILVYLLKIDRDVISVQEHGRYPYQTYTEQLLSENASCFGIDKLDFPRFCKSGVTKNSIDQSSIWRSMLLSYNSHVHHLLKHHKSSSITATTLVLIFHKQNICHKSSEDEELVCRCLNLDDQTQFNS